MLLLFVLEIFSLFLAFPIWGNSETMLQEANASYQQAETTTIFQERKQAFNRALYLYNLLDSESEFHTSALNRAIADTYFQLGEYAWAILYYQRALKIDPQNSLLISHLEKAQQKLGLPLDSAPSKSNPLTQFLFKLSQRFDLFLWIFLLTFLACSLAIWYPLTGVQSFAISSVLLLFLFLTNFLFFYYFTPLEGILVTSTGFYRAPDWNQTQLTTHPLVAGSKVRVLQATSEGNWLKIADSTDLVGYIPTNSLRLI